MIIPKIALIVVSDTKPNLNPEPCFIHFILLFVGTSLLFPLLPALDVTSDPSSVKPESSCAM